VHVHIHVKVHVYIMQLRVFVFVELLLDEPSDPLEIFSAGPDGRGGGTGGLDFSRELYSWICSANFPKVQQTRKAVSENLLDLFVLIKNTHKKVIICEKA
jgi:hypothetical protein